MFQLYWNIYSDIRTIIYIGNAHLEQILDFIVIRKSGEFDKVILYAVRATQYLLKLLNGLLNRNIFNLKLNT